MRAGNLKCKGNKVGKPKTEQKVPTYKVSGKCGNWTRVERESLAHYNNYDCAITAHNGLALLIACK